MSLILEALRKSEAERRRGQAPSLYSELPVTRPTPRRSAPWPWLLAVAALLLAALGWWRGQPAPSVPAHPNASIVAPQSEPLPAAGPAAEAHPANAAPRFVPAPAAKPGTAVAAPAPASLERPLPPPTARPARVPTPVEAAPVEAGAVANDPAAADSTAEPATRSEAELPALADLDSAERAELPALKLSMHVWNPQPEQRFVILDGQRLGEGGRAGDAVVETITRDGLILAWRSQRFRLARP